MSGLGIPILGDDFYPVLVDKPLGDFRRPLQLLASVVEFTDPITGALRRFETRLSLLAWRSHAEWADR
jgi:tRNA pseudouridine32 synthase/23S rRNA pseudouridine746 synthase